MTKWTVVIPVLALIVPLLLPLHASDQECGEYKVKVDLGYIVFAGSSPQTNSLRSELEKINNADPGSQWRIPSESDLAIIKTCPQLKEQLIKDVFYWTQIRMGQYYKCFKVEDKSGELKFGKRVSSDGAYGLCISDKGEVIPVTPVISDDVLPVQTPGSEIPSTTPKKDDHLTEPVTESKPEPLESVQYLTYEVKKGNTLWTIAQSFKHDSTEQGLIKLGELNSIGLHEHLKRGVKLKIPIPEECSKGHDTIKHSIKRGDTLAKISQQYLKQSFFSKREELQKAICTWNGISNPDIIGGEEEYLIIYVCK